MPSDILKDCNPIRVNASKLLTKINIIQERTGLLSKHIGNAVQENIKKINFSNYEEFIQSLTIIEIYILCYQFIFRAI